MTTADFDRVVSQEMQRFIDFSKTCANLMQFRTARNNAVCLRTYYSTTCPVTSLRVTSKAES